MNSFREKPWSEVNKEDLSKIEEEAIKYGD